METIFNNIINAHDNLEEILDSLSTKYLQDYYALFISAMAYWKVITISNELAAKLHVIVLNTDIKNTDLVLDKMYDFIVNKIVEDVCDEITREN